MFGLIRMPHTGHKTRILVCLHTGLDAVEREGRQGRHDTRRRCSNLGPVALDEALWLLGPVLVLSLPVRHVCCFLVAGCVVVASAAIVAAALRRHGRRLELRTILFVGLELSWHASWQSQALRAAACRQ